MFLVLGVILRDSVKSWCNIVLRICFKWNFSLGILRGDRIYKLRRVKGAANFNSSGSKIIKRRRRRQYDQVIIETTIDYSMLGPSAALNKPVLKRWNLTRQCGGGGYTGMTSRVQTSSEKTGSYSSSPVIVSRDSLSPWTSFHADGTARPTLVDTIRYFWYSIILYLLPYMPVYWIFITSRLAVGPRSL